MRCFVSFAVIVNADVPLPSLYDPLLICLAVPLMIDSTILVVPVSSTIASTAHSSAGCMCAWIFLCSPSCGCSETSSTSFCFMQPVNFTTWLLTGVIVAGVLVRGSVCIWSPDRRKIVPWRTVCLVALYIRKPDSVFL